MPKTKRLFPDRTKGADDLQDDLALVDPREFLFMKISRRVCLIRRSEGPEATGFLVGPDLVLTTAHALLSTSGIFADPDDVTILFDQFIWNARNGTKAWGAECKLRHIPFTTQPDVLASSIKTDPKSKNRRKPPDDDNGLDYVLVRLDQPVGLMYLPFSHRIRGWTNCSKAEIPAEGSVRVVQQPFGGLQEFASGTVYPEDGNDPEFPKFFKYRTTTLNGASGSPIFNDHNVLVGMHIGEKSEAEQLGVSFQAIFADLQKEGVTLPSFHLEKEMMDTLFGSSKIERERKPGTSESDWHGDRLLQHRGATAAPPARDTVAEDS